METSYFCFSPVPENTWVPDQINNSTLCACSLKLLKNNHHCFVFVYLANAQWLYTRFCRAPSHAASYHIQSWLISFWLWTELIAVLFPNSFWFYSSLNYCESLLLSSICEQDNCEFQIISAHAALFGHSCFPCPFLFSTPVDSPSHPISYSLPSQMSCYIPLKTIISDFNMTENVRTYSYVAYSQ